MIPGTGLRPAYARPRPGPETLKERIGIDALLIEAPEIGGNDRFEYAWATKANPVFMIGERQKGYKVIFRPEFLEMDEARKEKKARRNVEKKDRFWTNGERLQRPHNEAKSLA